MKVIKVIIWLIILTGCGNDHKPKLPSTLDEAVFMLDSIYYEDQKHRFLIDETKNEYGSDSPEMQKLWATILENDKSNLEVVKYSLDKFGWLSDKVAGVNGNIAQFLVIQHADFEIRSHYLPIMREAVANNNARAVDLALVEDRTALDQKQPQIYGSQISFDETNDNYYVLPLVKPDSVNVRRQSVGLQPIEQYLDHWGLTWDVEAYKENLPYYYSLNEMK